MYAGSPLAPSVSLNVGHLTGDSFSFALSWSTPFTWPNFPILSYKVILTNYSSGEPTMNTTVLNMNDSSVVDNNREHHQIEYIGQGSHCYKLSFSVEASNSIGKGEPTTLHAGQPIAIGK